MSNFLSILIQFKSIIVYLTLNIYLYLNSSLKIPVSFIITFEFYSSFWKEQVTVIKNDKLFPRIGWNISQWEIKRVLLFELHILFAFHSAGIQFNNLNFGPCTWKKHELGLLGPWNVILIFQKCIWSKFWNNCAESVDIFYQSSTISTVQLGIILNIF